MLLTLTVQHTPFHSIPSRFIPPEYQQSQTKRLLLLSVQSLIEPELQRELYLYSTPLHPSLYLPLVLSLPLLSTMLSLFVNPFISRPGKAEHLKDDPTVSANSPTLTPTYPYQDPDSHHITPYPYMCSYCNSTHPLQQPRITSNPLSSNSFEFTMLPHVPSLPPSLPLLFDYTYVT